MVRRIFVDQLTVSAALQVWYFGWSRRSSDLQVYSFAAPMAAGRITLGLIAALFGPRIEWKTYPDHVGNVRSSDGQGQVIEVRDDVRLNALRVWDEILSNRPLGFWPVPPSEWHPDVVRLKLMHEVEGDLVDPVFQIRIVASNRHTGRPTEPAPRLLLRRKPWRRVLDEYAVRHGVTLRWHSLPVGAWDLRKLAKWTKRLSPSIQSLRNRLRAQPSAQVRGRPGGPERPGVSLAYRFNGLEQGKGKRSDLFWLEWAGIELRDVVVHSFSPLMERDAEDAEALKKVGGRVYGFAEGTETWRPGRRSVEHAVRIFADLARRVRLGRYLIDPGYRWTVAKVFNIIPRYCYWREFFEANRITLDVANMHQSPERVLAIRATGGVSIAYQHSISMLAYPSCRHTSGEHLQFVNAPLFARALRESGSYAGHYLVSGVINVGRALKENGRQEARILRSELTNAGATFIVTYFDENTDNHWSCAASDLDTQKDYAFLLEWLEDDDSLGLLLKPKHPEDLEERLGLVWPRLRERLASGRCKLVVSPRGRGKTPAVTTALASDLCIGDLAGATAAMEAWSAGCMTVLVDSSRFPQHPLRQILGNQVIFDSWCELRSELEKVRRSGPWSHGGPFGDWTHGARALDPFRDGLTAKRIGSVIGDIHRAIASGATATVALDRVLQNGEHSEQIMHLGFNEIGTSSSPLTR